jgi:hypothetical protein
LFVEWRFSILEKEELEIIKKEIGGMSVLAALKGVVRGNTVVVKDDDIRKYDGAEVLVTLLNHPVRTEKKTDVDWDSFVVPSERGKNVDEYMREMRESD